MTAEYPVGHYAARLTAIDNTFGTADDHLRTLITTSTMPPQCKEHRKALPHTALSPIAKRVPVVLGFQLRDRTRCAFAQHQREPMPITTATTSAIQENRDSHRSAARPA